MTDEWASVYAVDLAETLENLKAEVDALGLKALSVRRGALMVEQMNTEARLIEVCNHLRWAAVSIEDAQGQLSEEARV
jgi:hypothetical protein